MLSLLMKNMAMYEIYPYIYTHTLVYTCIYMHINMNTCTYIVYKSIYILEQKEIIVLQLDLYVSGKNRISHGIFTSAEYSITCCWQQVYQLCLKGISCKSGRQNENYLTLNEGNSCFHILELEYRNPFFLQSVMLSIIIYTLEKSMHLKMNHAQKGKKTDFLTIKQNANRRKIIFDKIHAFISRKSNRA